MSSFTVSEKTVNPSLDYTMLGGGRIGLRADAGRALGDFVQQSDGTPATYQVYSMNAHLTYTSLNAGRVSFTEGFLGRVRNARRFKILAIYGRNSTPFVSATAPTISFYADPAVGASPGAQLTFINSFLEGAEKTVAFDGTNILDVNGIMIDGFSGDCALYFQSSATDFTAGVLDVMIYLTLLEGPTGE